MSSTPLLLEESTRILVPVVLPDPEPLTPWLIGFLCPLDVHVVGCYVVKDQTTPEQARDQFEDEATEQLDQVVERFRQAGAQVDSRLVFTPDIVETIDRACEEYDIDLVISPAAIERVSSLLCVVSDAAPLGRMRQCMRALLADNDVPVTLLSVGREGDDEAAQQEAAHLLDGVAESLADEGVAPSRVETRAVLAEDPAEHTVDISREFDVVLMSETETKLRDRLLRDAPSPLIVVRSRSED